MPPNNEQENQETQSASTQTTRNGPDWLVNPPPSLLLILAFLGGGTGLGVIGINTQDEGLRDDIEVVEKELRELTYRVDALDALTQQMLRNCAEIREFIVEHEKDTLRWKEKILECEATIRADESRRGNSGGNGTR